METIQTEVPWYTTGLWKTANRAISHTIDRNLCALSDAQRLALEIKSALKALFPLMDGLCIKSCPDCDAICCSHAFVWFDFRDLLFLHLADIVIPQKQLRKLRGDHCLYHCATGCQLERIQRPFICTWYLCPSQTRCLREELHQMDATLDSLNRIKQLRKKMEKRYIEAVI